MSIVGLKSEAIRCFLLLNELSLAFDVIGLETFGQRMRYLDEFLSEPDARVDDSPSITEEANARQEIERNDRAEPAHEDILGNREGRAPPDWLLLIWAGRWKFIKGDPDPHPSVPHGHDQGHSFPKLDPYLGWIHASSSETCGRLSKSDTRELWNDERFRDFASTALMHFIQENPNYVWRVERPLRLPRRR